jgi:hypothetical protein
MFSFSSQLRDDVAPVVACPAVARGRLVVAQL